MAIEIYCSKCFTGNGLEKKECSKCGTAFTRDKKFRVRVQVKGKRVSRVVDNLTIARQVEAALKGDLIRDEFEIAAHRVHQFPTLDSLWAKYLPWCKEHKRSWKDDEWNYNRHLKPRFGTKTLESIWPLDIERMKIELKKGTNKNGKPFMAATIKHQVILLRRLFNLAGKWQIYTGPNLVSSVELPKLDNQVTEYLSDDELNKLRNVLDSWPCHLTASLVKFAMLTGVRRGELFGCNGRTLISSIGLSRFEDPRAERR